ncbi:hypothetical protein NE293_01590 [Latilactobacillus curvatus]|uniref:hypothetical protein n=2 Tax=Latilactobacillus curvatus TaxID=28038 RepID=UPI0018C1C997|nr:hypothetical protein [Latilactobacillus curvatus]MCM6843374.1 hypothetical protein [Latilactobacillus curvatus]MCM6861774.1 hypothetical protein [Latilactobacillus curvatus]QPG02596.1 hypothetical protein INH01_06140 [Latilactobacillus sakei]
MMTYDDAIARLLILESNKNEPHDFSLPDFDQDSVKDTAIRLINNGAIDAEIIEDYSSVIGITFE